MASPDWTPYVDLSINDLDATGIFDEAIEYARTALPEWIPQAGNIEVILLEAIAVEAANVIAAINRVPGATTETLLKLYGVERSDGELAHGTIQVITINTNGYTIPGGSNFAYFPPDGTTPLVYLTDDDLIIPNGFASGTVTVTAQAVGSVYNEPSAGSTLQFLETVPFIQSVTFNVAPSGGASAETDDQFFQRAINTLQSYSAALTTADQIASYVLVNYPDIVFRSHVFDRERSADRDTSAPAYSPEAHVGYALVVVAGQNSSPTDTSDTQIDAGDRQTIQDDLQARVNPGLVVEVVNAEIVDVAPSVTVKKVAGYTATQVEDAIKSTLTSYLSSNSWDWDSSVRVNELISLIDDVEGVNYVVSIDGIDTTSDNASGGGTGQDLDLHLVGTLTTPDAANFVVTVT